MKTVYSMAVIIPLLLAVWCEISYGDQHEAALDEKEAVDKVYVMEPVIVTATKTVRKVFDVPQAATVVETSEISRKCKLSILDGLQDKVGIWVEKRTTTTSDPVMRGMSGFNILALIDGNTLSTLWGEGGVAGDDMYGKVDADNVERIEVVRGPSSVL